MHQNAGQAYIFRYPNVIKSRLYGTRAQHEAQGINQSRLEDHQDSLSSLSSHPSHSLCTAPPPIHPLTHILLTQHLS